ncbi:hypothetical protein KR074_002431, partial [Drosophila pseudoananassae]
MGKDRGRGRPHKFNGPYNKGRFRGQKRDRFQSNGHQRNRATPYQKITLREDQVAITEFTNPEAPGFTGILKSRFSDFHVNEIDTEGKVLELNDLTVPKVVIEPVDPQDLEKWKKELESVIGADVWQEIANLAESKYDATAEQKVEIDVSSLDKEKRTQVHQLVKQLYKGKLVSTTIGQQQVKPSTEENPPEAAEEKKTIRILKPKSGRSDNRWSFPGEYVTFLVHKSNMDTVEVASTLASKLNLRPSQVNYCGTKDKRAKTTQNFSIKRRSPDSILAASRSIRDVHVGNFGFRSTTLKLGDLQGNRFRIALRHVARERRADIEASLESVKERGFINYYGLQRFGNSASVPTYEIGVALLKCNYKLACELILKPRDTDVEFLRPIRDEWWMNRNSAAAAAKIHSDKFIEKKLLDGLARFGESDYAPALRQIPRNMLMLYPHAYQSFIFNRIASKRIKEFGLKLIPGDLVYVEDLPTQPEEKEEVNEEEVAGESTDDLSESAPDAVEEDAIEEESIFKRKVRPLTEEDIASGKFKITDVVLPLPGHDITYPGNQCREWYEEMLAEEGLTSEMLKHKDKTYSLGGAYRKLIIQPNDLKWSFRRYNTPEDTLIASDWERLRNIPITEEPEEEEAKFLALLLEFSLPTAVYATMFLRELFKKDTSTAIQMHLEWEAMTSNKKKDVLKVEKDKEVVKEEEEGLQEEKEVLKEEKEAD